MQTQLEELADRLDAIGEQLADLGLEVLQEALATATTDSETSPPKMAPEQAKREKQLARARNAVLKAAAVLRSQP